MFGGKISYGKYELKDSLIILKDKLKFGMENMNDTLKVTNDGILFTMEKPWRINEGKMSFEYKPKAELEILNNTNHNIDSIAIKLSYTKQSISTLSIKPKQKTKYKFNNNEEIFKDLNALHDTFHTIVGLCNPKEEHKDEQK